MRKLISLLNPIYWTTAQELGEAVNGYTLTDGIFRRETQVEFATGECSQDRFLYHKRFRDTLALGCQGACPHLSKMMFRLDFKSQNNCTSYMLDFKSSVQNMYTCRFNQEVKLYVAPSSKQKAYVDV